MVSIVSPLAVILFRYRYPCETISVIKFNYFISISQLKLSTLMCKMFNLFTYRKNVLIIFILMLLVTFYLKTMHRFFLSSTSQHASEIWALF